MPRTNPDPPDDDEEDDYDPEDDEDDYDPEDSETYPAGLYDDDGPAMVPCQHCGAEVFEDSDQCPKCGEYLTREEAAASKSTAWWVLILLALAMAIMWAAGNG